MSFFYCSLAICFSSDALLHVRWQLNAEPSRDRGVADDVHGMLESEVPVKKLKSLHAEFMFDEAKHCGTEFAMRLTYILRHDQRSILLIIDRRYFFLSPINNLGCNVPKRAVKNLLLNDNYLFFSHSRDDKV